MGDGSDAELDALKDPNVQWVFASNVATCPAGDSVVAGHARSVSIQVQYSSSYFPRVGVPPESIWVVVWSEGDEHHSSNALPFDYTIPASADSAKIFAEDSTNADGRTWIRITALAGCGTMGMRLFVSGVVKREGSVEVRSVDSDGDGVVTSADVSNPCDINYSPFGDDAAIVEAHLDHSHRQALHGTPVRRTNTCDTCEAGGIGTLGGSTLSWSPDGKRLAYTMFLGTDTAYCAVHFVPSDPVDGNVPSQITYPPRHLHDYNPSWSPLGDKIMFDRADDTIFVQAPLPNAQRTVVTVYDNGNALRPLGDVGGAISSDGQWVAFSRHSNDHGYELWKIPIAGATGGGVATQLTSTASPINGDDVLPQWSPDGQWIYFQHDPGSTLLSPKRVLRIHPDGTGLDTVVAYAGKIATCPNVSPDGVVVAIGGGDSTDALTRTLRVGAPVQHDFTKAVPSFLDYVSTATSEGGEEGEGGAPFLSPRFSPDGTRIVMRTAVPGHSMERPEMWATRRNMSKPPTIASVGGATFADSTPVVNLSVLETHSLSATVSASDPEGDQITYKVYSVATGLGYSIGSSTGVLAWTPSRAQGGYTYTARLQAETASGGTDYVIARIAVTDTTHPGQVSDVDVDLLSDTEVWPLWTAPGEDGAYGQCVAYDVRYSTSTITSGNFTSALQASGAPAPASVGGPQEFAITGLNPNTDYWIALKAKDAAGNWSLMSNVLHVKTVTSGGGGGGSRARQVDAGSVARARAATVEVVRPGVSHMTGLAAEERVEQGVPKWSVYFVDSSEVSRLAEGAGAGIVQQVPDGHGGWTTWRRLEPTGSRFALRSFQRPGRVVFLGDYGLIQAWSGVSCDGGNAVLDVTSAHQSQMGDVTASVESTGVYGYGLALGDTLTLAYAESQENDITQEWFLLFGAFGDVVGENALRHPRIETRSKLPTSFALWQNHPNPFVGATTIRFDLPVDADVRLDIFDAQGRRIRTLANGRFPAGFQSLVWDHRAEGGFQVGAGVYLYRLRTGTFRGQRKMVLLAK